MSLVDYLRLWFPQMTRDFDFLSFFQEYIDEVMEVVGPRFKESDERKQIVNADKVVLNLVIMIWALIVNWRGTRKSRKLIWASAWLYSVLKRMWLDAITHVSFAKLEASWKHRSYMLRKPFRYSPVERFLKMSSPISVARGRFLTFALADRL